jgi:hypothetical protein
MQWYKKEELVASMLEDYKVPVVPWAIYNAANG